MTGKTKYTQSSQQQKRIQFFLASFLLLPFLLVCIVESLLKLFIPKKRKSVTGEIVLITGAGHGIGRQTAYEFAKLKCKLVLWDINKVIVLPVFYFLVPLICGAFCWQQPLTAFLLSR
jgi:hypothetical protein